MINYNNVWKRYTQLLKFEFWYRNQCKIEEESTNQNTERGNLTILAGKLAVGQMWPNENTGNKF